MLIGGAARSEAVRRLAPAIFGVPVTVPAPGRVRRARRGAPGGLGPAGTPAPARPGLQLAVAGTSAEYTAEPTPEVRERYAEPPRRHRGLDAEAARDTVRP